jgi:hypothetical protein
MASARPKNEKPADTAGLRCHFGKFWSGRRDSNPRPRPWQGRALPLSYTRIREIGGDCSPATGRAMPNAARECNSPCEVQIGGNNAISTQSAEIGPKSASTAADLSGFWREPLRQAANPGLSDSGHSANKLWRTFHNSSPRMQIALQSIIGCRRDLRWKWTDRTRLSAHPGPPRNRLQFPGKPPFGAENF